VSAADQKNIALMVGGVVLSGLITFMFGKVAGLCVLGILLVIAVVLWGIGQRNEDDQADFSNIFARKEVASGMSHETGPEVALLTERMFYEHDDRLFVQHVGGGSARNIQVGQMNNGHWTADFDFISYLVVGGKAEVKPRFTAVSPLAIREQATGGRMNLAFFLLTSLDPVVKPIPVTVSLDDAYSQGYEIDFEATYTPLHTNALHIMEQCVFEQKARRIMPLSSS
jgi:hypothetical protein